MRIRCPACHAEHSLEAAVEDDAARELMGVLADLPREVSRPLAAYLGLWRARTRALAWERALRISREALALHPDTLLVGAALSETVEAMRGKQAAGGWKPLGNHNYLKRVLESLAARGATGTTAIQRPDERQRAPASRTAQALQDLESWRLGE
jgi:hypothetical protein